MSDKIEQIKRILMHKKTHTDGEHIYELFDGEVITLPISFYNTARNSGRWR